MRRKDSAQNVIRSYYPGRDHAAEQSYRFQFAVSVGSGYLGILVRLSEVLLPMWQDDKGNEWMLMR
jgi:hypothetical protein